MYTQQDAIKAQIRAINKKIQQGKVKNVLAAKIKCHKLMDQLYQVKLHNFLAR